MQMKSSQTKLHPTIGCCGIDCGLCPRFHTVGKSKCPGCFGENFVEKHPSCSIITCCVKNRKHETCASCSEFLCEKLQDWDKIDSFVTHRNSLHTLRLIKDHGIDSFLNEQQVRMNLLKILLENIDDGRSKSFFCLSANLLPIDELLQAIRQVKEQAIHSDKKILSKLLKASFMEIAEKYKVELIYRKNA
jgi:hypothetical protein